MRKRLVVSLILVATYNAACADSNNVSQQIQLLNSQIQAQLQKVQTDQQGQIQALNKQIQIQIKQMQTDLQTQIQTANAQTQAQLKQLQTTLQDQIKAIQQPPVQPKQ